MPSYDIGADGMFYSDGTEAKCLISFWDFYKNRGALPLNTMYTGSDRVLPVILKKLANTYGVLAGAGKSHDEELACMIAVAAVFDQSLLGYRPLRVLITGGKSGAFAATVAAAAREAHPKSRVYTLTQDLYGDAFFYVMNSISDTHGNLRRMAISANDDVLRDGTFDIAVAQKEQDNGDLKGSLQNIMRSLKPGGTLVCVTGGDSRLSDGIMALNGAAPEIYGISGDNSVLIKRVAAGDYKEPGGAREELETLIKALRGILSGAGSDERQLLRDAVSVLVKMERAAIKLFDVGDIDLKLRINEATECALNSLYGHDESYRQSQYQKLWEFALDTGAENTDIIVIEREVKGQLEFKEFETHTEMNAYFAGAAKKKGSPKLSIAIMSHRSLESLKTCVECVLRFTKGMEYELVLMDNASEDGGETLEFMRRISHPRKKVIEMRDNMGSYFNAARGWSTLWNYCEGDYILHLNDDHYVTENAVQNMIRALDDDHSIGMVNPKSSNAWMMQDPWLSFSSRGEMFEAAKAFNVYDPKKWEERIYVAAVAWMFRREVLCCMQCANPFGPEMCYDMALRFAGYRVMLLGDTWVHHNHDYSQKKSYGFVGETPEKIKQRENIDRSTSHLTFGLKLFEDICVFEHRLALQITPPKQEPPRLLSVDVRAGQGLLDLKNALRGFGVFNTKSTAFCTAAKYYPLLFTMADEVFIGAIDAIDDIIGDRRFDYIIVGTPVDSYENPDGLVSVLLNKLLPGGELLYKRRGADEPHEEAFFKLTGVV